MFLYKFDRVKPFLIHKNYEETQKSLILRFVTQHLTTPSPVRHSQMFLYLVVERVVIEF